MKEAAEIKKALCSWCKAECGVLVHVRGGRLIKAVPDPDWPRKVWPPTRGCPRLKAVAEWFYHPDRVNFPLKRVGERGEGKWRRISWEQALDEIAAQLKGIKAKYGPEAIATTSGTGGRADETGRYRFFHLLGSPTNPGQSQICFGPRTVMADTIVGMFPHFSIKPVTRCIVLLGCEPLVSRPTSAKILLDARKRGARFIVIDPRRTRSASTADVWLPVRPGTDAALLLGMIQVVIEEELYDKEFVANWCYGFDRLRERAREYPPAEVERITGVSADKVREAARVYATNRPGCMIEGMGIEHLENNAEVLHARWILAALAGNIDVEGGEELKGPHPRVLSIRDVELSEALSAQQRKKQLGADRFKLHAWPGQELIEPLIKKVWGKAGGGAGFQATAHAPTVFRAMLTGQPYPVKALITATSNPMVTQGNTKLVYRALKQLELYVVMDPFLTPSAELADYVLPPASWLERPSLRAFGDYSGDMLSGEQSLPASIPGEYERRTDYEFFRGLGLRLGQGKHWPWKNLEELYDYRLKPAGFSHREYVHQRRYEQTPVKYKKYLEQGFGTTSGKVELYSLALEKLGYDPLPRYVEPAETPISNPALAREYPLTLITGGRTPGFYHSEWRQIESVRKAHPYPLLQIHPDTAAKLDIRDGDWVWIETRRGRVKHKASLFDGIDPRVVHAEHGWWLPEMPGEEPWLHGVWEVNINVLTDDDPEVCNPILGTWPLRTALCKVYKVRQY